MIAQMAPQDWLLLAVVVASIHGLFIVLSGRGSGRKTHGDDGSQK